jgi:hypothetical protein
MKFENAGMEGGFAEDKRDELSEEEKQELLKRMDKEMGEYRPADKEGNKRYADLKYRAPVKPDKDVPGQAFTNLG